MSDVRRWPLPFGESPQLEVLSQLGDLTLIAVGEGEEPAVETTVGEDLAIRVSKDGELVRVEIGREGGWLEFLPEGPVTLRVPRQVRARVRTELGRMRVEGLDHGCNLELSTSAGAIDLTRCAGRIALRTGAGKISGRRLSGTFDVETAAGAVRLGITGLEPGHHRIQTNMGEVRVDLAPGLAVRIEARTGMGSARVRYPSAPDAAAVLHLNTDLGAVKVREGSESDDRHGDYPRWEPMPPFPPFIGSRPRRWAKAWARAWEWPGPPAPPQPEQGKRVGEEELRRILTMIEQGKITAADAEKLIRAIEGR
ncbi:MAG TPA: hypothetical protein VE782_12815 [Myxococcaceae bacterium]|nr:hypothetical protein [Myxococcaceae bacterium]